MEKVLKIQTISQLFKLIGSLKVKHPLIDIVNFNNIDYSSFAGMKFTSSFYTIMFKSQCSGNLKYGRNNYDYQEGTLVFIAPEQVISIEEELIINKKNNGWGLYFHPDLIRGTSLNSKMKEYNFFGYEANEALHLSEKEKFMLKDIVKKIELELSQNIDKHSQTLIISNIELLLNYSLRFYDRQFITRKNINKGILSTFEIIIKKYLNSDEVTNLGLPTVKYCADKLNLSPNYLSDLLKKETGKNTQEHIHYYLIEEAKNKLLLSNQSISEIAYTLGFEYPQYFSKIFKRKTGLTPVEYRNLN